MASPDSDEEYLDDPIQLIHCEQKRITAAVKNYNSANTEPAFELTDPDGDVYIEKNKNISYKRLPLFKKVSITLPVTFFEKSRNVEQLNRCKPLSIKVVNCVEFPCYYKKYLNKNSADNEVEFYSNSIKQSERNDEDVMMVEGSKIKIRPVTSSYENLNSRNNTIRETRESEQYECRESKQKMHNGTNQRKDTQVDFKKNQGLIGMKITQSLEKPSKIVQKRTKRKLDKQKQKNQPKVNNTSKETITCKTKDILTTCPFVTTVTDSNDKVVRKCGEDIKNNKNVKASETQDVKNSAKIADTSKINSTKVEGDEAIPHNTDFNTKINLVKISKVQEVNDKQIQNNSKTVDNNNKCNYFNKKSLIQETSKLVTNCEDSTNDIAPSAFFTYSGNVQKPKTTTNKTKQESKSAASIKYLGCKVKGNKDCTLKVPKNVRNNKSNDIFKNSLEVITTENISKSKQKFSKGEEISNEICNNVIKITGNRIGKESLKSARNRNSILDMKLVQPKNNVPKKYEFSKTVEYLNQKINWLSNDVANVNLVEERNTNIKQMLPKTSYLNDSEKDSKVRGNNMKLLNEFVKTPVLVKNYSKIDSSLHTINTAKHKLNLNDAPKDNSVIGNNIKLLNELVKSQELVKQSCNIESPVQNTNAANSQINPSDIKNTGKQSRTHESSKIQPSAFYVKKYAKIMEPSSEQTSEVSHSHSPKNQFCTSFKNDRGNNNTTKIKNQIVDHKWMPVIESNNNNPIPNQPTNKSPIPSKPSYNNPIQAKPYNPRNLDIINLTDNNISAEQQLLPLNVNLNTELTHLSAPKETSTNQRSFSTCPSGESIETRITTDFRTPRDPQSVRSQHQPCNYNNFVTQPCTLQIPLNIPPEPKRCPRVIRISKRYPETIDSITSHLQLAQNSLHKISFDQPYKNANKTQIQGQPHLATFENIKKTVLKQKHSAVQKIQEATNPQMLAHYHAAAQQIVQRPPGNQTLMFNQQNIYSDTSEYVPRQLPTLNTKQNMPQMTTTQILSQERTACLLTANQQNKTAHEKTAHEILPPTCDIAVIQTLPRHELNANNSEFQLHNDFKLRQPLKTNRLPIILRKPVNKQQIQLAHMNNYSTVTRQAVTQNFFPQNFGHNAELNAQPYSLGFQKANLDFNQISPQNYIHCAPIYDGLPSNMNYVNSAPYDNYWNNYYHMMLPPPPSPPPYSEPIQPQEHLRLNTSQTCAPNCITSTPKSVTGTAVIGCNEAGPVRKINILAKSSKTSINTEPKIFEPFQTVNNGTKQTQLTETANNEILNRITAGAQNVKQFKEMLGDSHTVNSKREMLEELTKITTIESSRFNTVNTFNKFLPTTTAKTEQLNMLNRSLPELDARNEKANVLNKSIPESDAKQDKGNLKNRPQSRTNAKQQEENLPNKPLPKADANQDVGNLLKRPLSKTDAKQEESDSLKRSLTRQKEHFINRLKPGPLSKKFKLNAITSPKRTLQTSPMAHNGYSPPILPIPTYQKTLEILARSNIADSNLPISTKNETETESANITRKYICDKKDKLAKKISLDEYKKRCHEDVKVGELQVDKIKIEIKSENPEQDLGYDSDGTMKLL